MPDITLGNVYYENQHPYYVWVRNTAQSFLAARVKREELFKYMLSIAFEINKSTTAKDKYSKSYRLFSFSIFVIRSLVAAAHHDVLQFCFHIIALSHVLPC